MALIWLMFVASFAEMTRLVAPLQALAICLCAFLVFNMRSPWRSRASIFLGDARSTALGATIAYIILLLATGSMAVTFPALIWVVILPVTDTLSLIVRRIMAGRSAMSADRWHLHHLLLDHGFSASATANTLIVVSAICGGIGYAGIRANIPGEIMAIGLLVPLSLHTILVLATTGHLATLGSGRGRFEFLTKGTVISPSTSDSTFPSPLSPTPLKDE